MIAWEAASPALSPPNDNCVYYLRLRTEMTLMRTG